LLFFMGWSTVALAQEPPLDIPKKGILTKATDTLAAGGWRRLEMGCKVAYEGERCDPGQEILPDLLMPNRLD
jgi:hypothetical protein